jgi:hypothetical protein
VNVSHANVLHNWVYIGSNTYDEYTFLPWLNKNVYRRPVDLTESVSSERHDEHERKGFA